MAAVVDVGDVMGVVLDNVEVVVGNLVVVEVLVVLVVVDVVDASLFVVVFMTVDMCTM